MTFLMGKSNVAFALRAGLYAALLHGHKKVLVEGDSKIIIDCLNKKCRTPWRIISILDDINILASKFDEISFNHVWHEANFAADAVASCSQDDLRAMAWTTNFPLKIRKAVRFDSSGIGCLRGASL
ncbi:hypothetical protein OROMI_004202 [Orobanche minor]